MIFMYLKNLFVITRFLPLKKNMQQPSTNLLIKSQSLKKSSILSTLSIIIVFALCGLYFMDYSSVTLKWLSSQGIVKMFPINSPLSKIVITATKEEPWEKCV